MADDANGCVPEIFPVLRGPYFPTFHVCFFCNDDVRVYVPQGHLKSAMTESVFLPFVKDKHKADEIKRASRRSTNLKVMISFFKL